MSARRKRWPVEAPVFEVVRNPCATAPVGEYVVGVEVKCYEKHPDWIDCMWPFDGHINFGTRWSYSANELRPLTPAAEDMIAIARGGAS